MKGNFADVTLLKSLLKGHWMSAGPWSILRFLSRDKEAFALLEKIMAGSDCDENPGLAKLYAEAKAIRDANAAAAAIDAILQK